MALVGVELETLVFEPDAQTTRPASTACGASLVQCVKWREYIARLYNPSEIYQL